MNENAKCGYDKAIFFADMNIRTIWSVFTALVAVNTFLVLLATFLFSHLKNSNSLTTIIGIIGLFICFMWVLIMHRSIAFFQFYLAWARKYEKDAFDETVILMRASEAFGKGKAVTIGDQEESRRLSIGSVRVMYLIDSIVVLYALIYTYILIYGGDLPWK